MLLKREGVGQVLAPYRNRKYRRLGDKKTIDWIELLYDRPLDNFSKHCIWRIFVPYFINVKGLPRSDAFNKISLWKNEDK